MKFSCSALLAIDGSGSNLLKRIIHKCYRFVYLLNSKTNIMKKFLSLLAIAGLMTACNDSSTTTDNSAASDTATTTETAPVTVDTSATSTATTAVKDSVMQYKDGKVMIMVAGSWTALASPVTTTNGRKVSPDGEVSKGGKTRKLEEGMMIDKDGQMMDKDGKMVDNTGWE